MLESSFLKYIKQSLLSFHRIRLEVVEDELEDQEDKVENIKEGTEINLNNLRSSKVMFLKTGIISICIYRVVIFVCLIVSLIITHEPLDR